MNEEALNDIEDTIEELPDEVSDFIFGDELKTVKKEVTDLVEKDDEKTTLSNMIMFFLLGVNTIQELNDYIGTLTITDDKKSLIGSIIQEKIINELLLLIEVHQEIDSAVANTTAIPNASNLSSLIDRLKQTSSTTPITRDYSLNTTATTPKNDTISVETSKPAIDPYHEAIDNE